LVKVSTSASIVIMPKIPVGKSKYGCRYCNETPTFKLVEVSISSGIASLNEKTSLSAIPTCLKKTHLNGLDTLK
jgi:hypothetical protein